MLQTAYTAGQIGHEEFEDRRQFCLRARYVDDLSGLISDLPAGDKWRKEEPADSPPERIIVADEVSPYSEVMVLRRGTVRMSPSMSTIRSLVVMGSSTIHIEDIMAPGVVIELNLKSVLGTFILYVPWRVQIINQSLNILSAIDIESEADGGIPEEGKGGEAKEPRHEQLQEKKDVASVRGTEPSRCSAVVSTIRGAKYAARLVQG